MLVPPELLQVKPARALPLMYVRRFRFVDDELVVRDFALLPGLNIVWSKDEADENDEAGAPGHAAGKTLLVSLIRYALGGADLKESTREKVLARYANARVAVDIVLDGEEIVIVRSLRSQMLAAVIIGEPVAQVHEVQLSHRYADVPLLERLAPHLFLKSEVDALDWRTLVDITTRDQETRFDDVAMWRNRDGRDAGERNELLLRSAGLYSPAEHAARVHSAEKEEAKKAERRTSEGWRYVVKDLRADLRNSFSVGVDDDAGDLLVAEALLSAAEDNVHRASDAPSPDIVKTLAEIKGLEGEKAEIDKAIGEVQAAGDVIPLARRRAERDVIARELETLIGHRTETAGELCPLCRRAADNEDMLAELRKNLDLRIDNRTAELATMNARIEQAEERQENQETIIAAREMERGLVEQQLAEARSRLRKAEFRADQQVFAAKQLREAAAKHRKLVVELASEPQAEETVTSAVDVRTETAVTGRRRDFRRQFSSIVRMLLGAAATGTVELKGNGVRLGIVFGGEKNSPAYRVIGVLAFDVAAMVARAEGRAAGPAFFIHDSPREADMSLVVYEKYFETLGQIAAGFGDFFQAIVTTTTPPPAAFRKYLRLELQGRPDEKRLLKAPLG